MSWIERDLEKTIGKLKSESYQPIKVIKGPRQVGKTSFIQKQNKYKFVSFDDHSTRRMAVENPSFFLDQIGNSALLDEATYAPEIFSELKLRVDENKWNRLKKNKTITPDYWITGSNQTLLQKSIQESLAGRSTYFDLNTLSLHELRNISDLKEIFLRGGWPELHANKSLAPVSHLNNLISTYIEKDIVSAAGIEKKDSFSKMLTLIAGRVGQLLNASDLAKVIGVDTTTVQSWIRILVDNGILFLLPPYFNNINQRWIKTPKIYFLDIGLAVRLQGWTQIEPMLLSPLMGSNYENLILSEIHRFLINTLTPGHVYFLRNKEKVEIDLLVSLPNQIWIAMEVKFQAEEYSKKQNDLLDLTNLPIREKWTISEGSRIKKNKTGKILSGYQIFDELLKFI